MKRFYIYINTNEQNNMHYQNSNRFVKLITVNSEIELANKIAELRNDGKHIINVYNAVGNKINF